MLPAKNRLTKKDDFVKAQRTGKVFIGDKLRLAIRGNGGQISKIGFIVGLHYSKKAHERNLIKRRLREAFKKILPQLKEGFDVVVSPITRVTEKINKKDIQADLEKIIQKSKLIKK